MRERDRGWVRGLFGQGAFKPDTKGENIREYTPINSSFSDTSIGGNQAINPIPQFTRYADPKCYGYLARNRSGDFIDNDQAGSYGMGRFYGENINNNAHYAHFRFGTPRYIGLLSFLTTMYNPDLARLTTDGMFSSFFRGAGAATAYVGMFVVLGPAIFFPLLACTKIVDMYLESSVSKYWYVKPQMHLYLQAVQSMLDTQLVHSRLVPFSSVLSSDTPDAAESGSKIHAQMLDMYSGLPSIWKSNGKFDVFKMINRYQILHDMEARNLEDIWDSSNGDPVAYNAAIESFVHDAQLQDDMRTRAQMNVVNKKGESVSILEAITNSYMNAPEYQVNSVEDVQKGKEAAFVKDRINAAHKQEAQAVVDDQEAATLKELNAADQAKADQAIQDGKPVLTKLGEVISSTYTTFQDSSWGTSLIAELHDGAQWVSFKVDGKGSVSDSFSNGTVEPQIASAINGVSSQARSMDMSLAGGVTGFAPLDAVTSSVANFLKGGIDALNLSGIAGVFGKSSVDIPEMWDSSSADIATESYTIHLRSPYGNDISLFQNITVPIMFILAGVLPMATGKQSYRNPFYCEVISTGRNTIRNGIITGVTLTRGTGNMGWRSDGRMLGCDVTIQVKDLSKVVAMPIIKDARIFADDNTYTDYMATLGAVSLHDLTYRLAKLTINFNQWKQSWKSFFMSGRITNSVSASRPARLIANFVTGTARG